MKFDITLKQYELIYKIVASVGRELSHGPGKSCQFYNVNGAFLLERVFKVKARPIMGAAFIRVTDSGDTISFAGEECGKFYSSPEAFHCWVETEHYIIDFTAPEYREVLSQVSPGINIKRNMLQKEKSHNILMPSDLVNVGDICFQPNPALTSYLLQKMFEKPAAQDLVDACIEWCKKSRKKISDLTIINDLGEKTIISPVNNNVIGIW
ncbi:hypothetical protein D3C72_544590 [compost metagenome]